MKKIQGKERILDLTMKNGQATSRNRGKRNESNKCYQAIRTLERINQRNSSSSIKKMAELLDLKRTDKCKYEIF